MMSWHRAICRKPNKGPCYGTLKAPRIFFCLAMRKLLMSAIRALGCLRSKFSAPQAQEVPEPVLLGCISGHVARVHTTCHSRCRRYVDGRVQHTRRILVQLCKHAENLVSNTLPACHDTTRTEPRIEACITCTCTKLRPTKHGPQIQRVCPQ
jgi:hypothetical protein